jgi:hypothetical protein
VLYPAHRAAFTGRGPTGLRPLRYPGGGADTASGGGGKVPGGFIGWLAVVMVLIVVLYVVSQLVI